MPLSTNTGVGTEGFRTGWHYKVHQYGTTPMPRCSRQLLICWSFPLLVLSGGCRAQPECDSIETRDAVLHFISEDGNNPLLDYAARNSTVNRDHTPSATPSSNAAPLYQLGQRIVTTSMSKDKQTLKCSGPLSVAVGDLKATKEVNFTVQQSKDGKLSVSVEPFQF